MNPNNSLLGLGLSPRDLQGIPIAVVGVQASHIQRVGPREYALFIGRMGAPEGSYLIDPKIAHETPDRKTAVFKVNEEVAKKLVPVTSKIRPNQMNSIRVEEHEAVLLVTYGPEVDIRSVEFRYLVCKVTGLSFDSEDCTRLIKYLERSIPGTARVPFGGGSSFRVISGLEEEKRANVGASHQPGTPFQQDLNNNKGAEPKVQEKQHGSRTVN